ncbi:phosphonate transport system ATP-binding protein [Caldanaerovirga acetigignens]|jgi:phosphonate transport system ATP-binding protein|uniref:Phosphonate transport system ATP-binding protein n=1 Tax=Caldanaerovirga acetigignens TaxID=447595 RepID=A0A1M7LP99_9FIRM|nr:phosphonate ABC transporter ATP-binding protein [Caldanaerovirga acetigignens]SHM80020.1 phosphonate transport system ATP-binding protein [Caldanaerovirga acetigignens]
MQAVLEVIGLKKKYKDGTFALRGIDFQVKEGEFVAVIGPSGAGKSTLMRCINRLVEPSEGKIYFNGNDMMKANGQKLRQHRREIGMIFQNFNLIPRVTVIDNVLNGRLGYTGSLAGALGIFSRKDRDFALEILARVGLADKALKRVDELSGGQQQRVGIARALAQEPKLILADEPIASLDPITSENIMEYIYNICREDGITCLINLHQVEIAKRYATRIIGIREGKKVFDGTPDELTREVIRSIYGQQK